MRQFVVRSEQDNSKQQKQNQTNETKKKEKRTTTTIYAMFKTNYTSLRLYIYTHVTRKGGTSIERKRK